MITFKEFLFENNDFKIQKAIDNIDGDFINKLIDKLSFLYKKKKDRYLRPVKIVGMMNDIINIRMNMSNKDIILFNYEKDELKIYINGDLVYYMDNINKKDIIGKVESYYKRYIEKQNFKIVNKNNPFD